MSQPIEVVNAWSGAWLELVLAILWQSTALACLAAIVAYALRRWPPAVGYWVWQIVAIKLLIMPFWIVWLPLPSMFGSSRAVAVAESHAADASIFTRKVSVAGDATLPVTVQPVSMPSRVANEPSLLSRIAWPAWLMLAWLVVIAWQVGLIVYQRAQLSRLLRRASPIVDTKVIRLLRELAQELGLGRIPAVLVTECECSPFVFGAWRATIVLPWNLLRALDETQLRQVLLHELAHVKRHDLLWGWLPTIARLVYWFHPVVHWVCYRIQLQRELACDQLAIALGGQGAAGYARTLVQVAGHASGGALFQAAAASAGFSGGAATWSPMSPEPKEPHP